MAEVQQQFIMTAPKQPQNQPIQPQNPSIPSIPAEAYLTYLKIIDPEGIYLNKLSRLLYSAYLIKTDTVDEKSPVPGYRLAEIGGDKRKTLVNWDGYNTVTNNYLLLVSEVISTTEFDLKEINLKRVCIDGVWSIIFQLVANWEAWEFTDETEILPLGIGMWFNVYGLSRRSTGGGKMLHFLTGLFKFLGPHRGKYEDENPNKVKFWGSNGNN